MDAVADLKIDLPGGSLRINTFIRMELGRDGRENTFPTGVIHVVLLKQKGLEDCKYAVNIFEI
jgi:hypothetical protein